MPFVVWAVFESEGEGHLKTSKCALRRSFLFLSDVIGTKNTDLDVILHRFAMYKVHNEINYTIEGKSVITHSDSIGE